MKKKSGFSLFEILITVSIITLSILLSVIFVPKQIIKAKDSKIKADLHQIYLALEDYYDTYKEFPKVITDCNQPLIKDDHIFLLNIPCDPFNKQNYTYLSNSNWFKIYANLKNTQDTIISLIGCTNGCGPECQYNYGVASTNISLDKCPGPTPIIFACSPGGGDIGHCEQYDDPVLSQCPKIYPDDEICNNECNTPTNRCKNASGKHQPE